MALQRSLSTQKWRNYWIVHFPRKHSALARLRFFLFFRRLSEIESCSFSRELLRALSKRVADREALVVDRLVRVAPVEMPWGNSQFNLFH
jgi:hypothetical protein